MYRVTYSIDGIIRETTINASDSYLAQQVVTNMYGSGKIQIISVRRV